jgi:folate-binding protein YgfZ
MSVSQWQSKLEAEGAHLTEGVVEYFGQVQEATITSLNDNVLCDLSHLGLLEISGEDRLSFLQGQVTNDVNLLNGSNAHYAGYCTPKGRLLAVFLAFAHQDHLHLQLPQSLVSPIMKRLKMYVLRSKVNITDTTDTIVKFGINGPDATRLLNAIYPSLPMADYELVSMEQATILKLPSPNHLARYQVFTRVAEAIQAWDSLKNSCKLVGKPCWDYLDINTGIPEVVTSTQEQFVPQMLNLDLLNGINFKKGCYTGQEIVARTHYLGSVKRRTYLAELATQETPQAGEKVTDKALNEIGQIVRVAPNAQKSFDALIEMRIESASDAYYHNTPITLKTQPYGLGETGS